ncbi:amidohydrolase [Alkalicoccus saliphilus]|uniref:Peptidase M20 n=1 Tax=Alkalicoccus saliphilus TaxID=200989 RepID=A0A2T4U4A7_9BACI|nr:amidohydrolase [Alkalicoccus saliphilus]PTL38232.1 peptidase M20 [Alkalicoccus saliphilus]
MLDKLTAFLDREEKNLIAARRELHQIAEPGWCEYQTTSFIVRFLEKLPAVVYTGRDVTAEKRMGLPPKKTDRFFFEKAEASGVDRKLLDRMKGGFTGAVAVLDTGRPGPASALRFDIDALPITEASTDHLPAAEGFASRNEGTMHACAHDGHTAIGLYTARFIAEHLDELTGTFTFLFQPAEEGSRGAEAMVAKGWLDHIDYFLSGHLGIHDLEAGTIASGTYQFLATTKLDAYFTGVSAHAGVDPSAGKNALLAAASAAGNLQAVAPPREGITRLNVGRLEAGEGRNIIPSSAFMMLETRGETTDLNDYMEKEARRIIEAAAAMYEVEVTIDTAGKGVAAASGEKTASVLKGLKGKRLTHVVDPLPLGGSEDAAWMMKRVQENGGEAAYLLYGTKLPYGHHHPQFDFDEAAMAAAVETLGLLIDYYHRKEK